MNRDHAQQVNDISSIMDDYAIAEHKVVFSNADIYSFLNNDIRNKSPDLILGDVMAAMGYRDWFQRLNYPDVKSAGLHWYSLTKDGKSMRIKWFVEMVQKWKS